MKKAYKNLFLIITQALMLIVLMTGFSFAEEIEFNENKVGIGYGIPYGYFGVNYENRPIDYLGLTAGLGVSPGGTGWAAGARFYPVRDNKEFRPRISLLFGTVRLFDRDELAINNADDHKLKEGFAIGIGTELFRDEDNCCILHKGGGVELDLFVTEDMDSPPGYEETDDQYQVSIGICLYF